MCRGRPKLRGGPERMVTVQGCPKRGTPPCSWAPKASWERVVEGGRWWVCAVVVCGYVWTPNFRGHTWMSVDMYVGVQ